MCQTDSDWGNKHTENGRLALQRRDMYVGRQVMQGVGVYLERDDNRCRHIEAYDACRRRRLQRESL